MRLWLRAASLMTGLACTVADPPATTPDPPEAAARLRRLSLRELDATVRLTFGDDLPSARAWLPAESQSPFDVMVAPQAASPVYTEAVEGWARAVTETLRARHLTSPPWARCGAGEADEVCVRRALDHLAARLLRRPLTAEERTEIVNEAVRTTPDPVTGGYHLVTFLLQDALFLYRVEDGTSDADGLLHLSGPALAERLAFTLTGAPPDDALRADTARLSDPAVRVAHARRLIESGATDDTAVRFHKMWLGFDQLDVTPAWVSEAFHQEADAFLHHILTTPAVPWTDLFLARYTIGSPVHATYYGLPAGPPNVLSVLPYADGRRSGLLAQGAFSHVASHADDTSPTKRAQLIYSRLMCSPVPEPPPTARSDAPPRAGISRCKSDRYLSIRQEPLCATCHERLDDLGLGLEYVNNLGGLRDFENVQFKLDYDYDCPVPATGRLAGRGEFHDVAELGVLLTAQEDVQRCMVDHLVQYADGRPTTGDDRATIDELQSKFRASGWSFRELMVALVAHPTFATSQLDP